MADRKKLMLTLTPELFDAIEQARGDVPRSPWIESMLRRTKAVRDAAQEIGVELPSRKMDERGRPPVGRDD